jgi:hypothetical protein
MRVIVQDVAILESAWLGLVTVAGDVMRLAVIMTDEPPLHATRESSSATTAQIGLLDLVDDLLGLHPESFLEFLVTAIFDVTLDVGSVSLGPGILENNAALLRVRRK